MNRQSSSASWLRLLHAPGVGPVTAAKILDLIGGIDALQHCTRQQLHGLNLKPAALDILLQNEPSENIENDLRWAEAPENHLIPIDDPRYPSRLKTISDAPIVLYAKGQLDVLYSLQLGMVGSRTPTPSGKETAFEFARHLAHNGFTITSGLALGIDAASHQGALAGGGQTVAVTATGLDRVYPAAHRELAQQIVTQGVMICEFPTGIRPQAQNFPRRNRIISALSIGTLVVEAAKRSGSLITARHAMEQGREVFAIPGSIHNPLARGCHTLIRQGAKLVETADDILEEVAPLIRQALHTTEFEPPKSPAKTEMQAELKLEEKHTLDDDYQKLLRCLDHSPTSIDTLVERSQLSVKSLSSMLLILELQNRIEVLPGGLYQCLK
ncbi:MAG: DNA-processing protein DprA [Gammaproteobacteria bacterium]|nr:DNA-processing protein DprA [Gammaproteobacteria bacterium]